MGEVSIIFDETSDWTDEDWARVKSAFYRGDRMIGVDFGDDAIVVIKGGISGGKTVALEAMELEPPRLEEIRISGLVERPDTRYHQQPNRRRFKQNARKKAK